MITSFLNAQDIVIMFYKILSPSSLLYSSDHPGNWSGISINMFALSDSSSSLTGIVIMLYHLISFLFTTGPRSC